MEGEGGGGDRGGVTTTLIALCYFEVLVFYFSVSIFSDSSHPVQNVSEGDVLLKFLTSVLFLFWL